MSSSDCQLSTYLLLTIPPCVSLLYAISVQIFLAGWHEIPWTHLSISIANRAAIAVAAFGISTALCHHDHDPFLPSLLLGLLLALLSLHGIYKMRTVHVQGMPPNLSSTSLLDRVVLVTGANAGIGLETARQLAAAGATVILACRSERRARDAMEDICQSIDGNGDGASASAPLRPKPKPIKDRLLFLEMDVSDLSSVRRAVQTFESWNIPLHVLVNNAGVMMGERRTSVDGFELTMACNHLGHFLLTNLLLPKLRMANDARVVIITSRTYALTKPGMALDDLNCERRPYSLFGQYAQSKLANILMGKHLATLEAERVQKLATERNGDKDDAKERRSEVVGTYLVHPGLVRTDVVRNMPWYLKYPNFAFAFVLMTLQKTPPAGAYTSVYCAADEALKGMGGEYYVNSEVRESGAFANDEEVCSFS